MCIFRYLDINVGNPYKMRVKKNTYHKPVSAREVYMSVHALKLSKRRIKIAAICANGVEG